MLDFGAGELVVIGVVALVAIGPKELPGLLRTVGQAVGRLRRMAGDFQNQFNEALREADMADAQKMIADIKSDVTGSTLPGGSLSPPVVMPTIEQNAPTGDTSSSTSITTDRPLEAQESSHLEPSESVVAVTTPDSAPAEPIAHDAFAAETPAEPKRDVAS